MSPSSPSRRRPSTVERRLPALTLLRGGEGAAPAHAAPGRQIGTRQALVWVVALVVGVLASIRLFDLWIATTLATTKGENITVPTPSRIKTVPSLSSLPGTIMNSSA